MEVRGKVSRTAIYWYPKHKGTFHSCISGKGGLRGSFHNSALMTIKNIPVNHGHPPKPSGRYPGLIRVSGTSSMEGATRQPNPTFLHAVIRRVQMTVFRYPKEKTGKQSHT